MWLFPSGWPQGKEHSGCCAVNQRPACTCCVRWHSTVTSLWTGQRAKRDLLFLRNIEKKLPQTMKRKEVENRLVICSRVDHNLWETQIWSTQNSYRTKHQGSYSSAVCVGSQHQSRNALPPWSMRTPSEKDCWLGGVMAIEFYIRVTLEGRAWCLAKECSVHYTYTFWTGVANFVTKTGWEGKKPLKVSVIQ